MPINSLIPLQTRVFQPRSTVEAYGSAMKLKNLAGQQKMQELQIQEAEKAINEKQKLKDLASSSGGDYGKFLEGYQEIDPLAAMEAKSKYAGTQIKAQSDEIDLMLKKNKALSQIIASATDQQSYENGIKQAVDMGLITPEHAAQVPPQFDPNYVSDMAKKSLDLEKQLSMKFEQTKFEETQNQNKIANKNKSKELSLKEEEMQMKRDKRVRPDAPAGFMYEGKELKPIKGGPHDPDVIKQEKTAALKAKEAAAFDPEQIKSDADYMLNLLKTIYDPVTGKEHPGLSPVVGAKNPFTAWTPGTSAADFKAYYDQVLGKQFMEAYKTLKGGGQITEVEGEKATSAMARMSTAQSEKAFKEGVKDFMDVVKALRDRALKRGGITPEPVGKVGRFTIEVVD